MREKGINKATMALVLSLALIGGLAAQVPNVPLPTATWQR